MSTSETDVKPKTEAKPEVKPGFDKPIPKSHKGALPDYVHPQTRMARGIAPDSGERVSINLAALQAEFGKKEGLDKYTRIAKAGGFYDPNTEPTGSSFFPDLSLEGMDKDARAEVDAILNEKE